MNQIQRIDQIMNQSDRYKRMSMSAIIRDTQRRLDELGRKERANA